MNSAKIPPHKPRMKIRGPYRIKGTLGIDILEAAAITGFSVKALRMRVHNGTILFRRAAGRIVFDPEDLKMWYEQLPGVTVQQALENWAQRGSE